MEKANGLRAENYGGTQRRRGLFLFISCLLLTVVFMAVPKSPNQGAAYFAKQIYYNHGADRGPRLGQRPRIGDSSGSQTKSRRLLVRADAIFEDHVTRNLNKN